MVISELSKAETDRLQIVLLAGNYLLQHEEELKPEVARAVSFLVRWAIACEKAITKPNAE